MADPQKTQTNEHERTPVPSTALKGQGKFWGMYAGEHAAGTEFMIGPLFLLSGITLSKVIFGLLIGKAPSGPFLALPYPCAASASKARNQGGLRAPHQLP